MDEIYAWNQQDIYFSFFSCNDYTGNKIIKEIITIYELILHCQLINSKMLFAAFAEACPPSLNNFFNSA